VSNRRQLWWTWALTTALATVFGVGVTIVMVLGGALEPGPRLSGTVPFPALHHTLALGLVLVAVVGSRRWRRRGMTTASCYVAWLPFLGVALLSLHFGFHEYHTPTPDFWAAAVLWLIPPVGLLLHPPPRAVAGA